MPNRKTQPFAFLLILLSTLSSLSQTSANPAFPPIPIDATEEQVHQAVALVRAGLNLAPKTWPEGARVAVCLSFDVDNELLWRRKPEPVPLSQGEYGATTALPRILDLLDRHAVPASFYIPAISASLHPKMIQDILQRKRHEIGVHGWMHENLASVEDGAKEQQLLTQSIDYLTRATGKRPVGFRAPAWEIIELPINWIADDYPYYEPDSSGSLPDPQLVFDVYKGEFDAAYEEHSLFILTLHPHISGHRSRIQALDRLIDYMKSKPGVWFATLEQVANYVKAQQGKSLVNKISD